MALATGNANSLPVLGPFPFSYTTPNVGTTGADLGAITSGMLVLGAYVIVTTAWGDSGTSKIGFYVFVSRAASTETVTDYFGSAFDVGSVTVGAEPQQNATVATGPVTRGAMVTDSTSRLSVTAFGEIASKPVIAGAANVYLVVARVTFP